MRVTRTLGVTACAALLFCAAFVSAGHSQTHRTKKPVKKPVATATPLPGEAEIVRTADEQDLNNYLIPNTPVQQDKPQVDPNAQELDSNAQKVKDLNTRVKRLESSKADPYEEKQKRMLLNLDILTRAEQRSEALRKELFGLMEKENTIRTRLGQIDYEARPDVISRSVAFAGTMKPEEIRDQRKKSLDAEKANLDAMLAQIESVKVNLTANLTRSDALVEKLRLKLEADIDNSFKDDDK